MGGEKTATFFVSTGRCGTQWLRHALSEIYADVAETTHEPISTAYQPKRYLRAYADLDELMDSPAVSDHVSRIREILRERHYIETGWPCYPAIPLMMRALGARVQVVHLVRHPANTALSLATHKVYRQRGATAPAAIDPMDRGVVQKDLADRWSRMTMYEKCLFWWTEINLYGLELKERYPEIRFHLVRFEDLFAESSSVLEDLIGFLGLPYRASVDALRSAKSDAFRDKSEAVDWRLIFDYPRTVALARDFGYPLDLEATEIGEREFLKLRERPRRALQRNLERLARLGGRLARRMGRN